MMLRGRGAEDVAQRQKEGLHSAHETLGPQHYQHIIMSLLIQ